MENHRGFPGYYLVILLIGTMPWSIVLLPAWWCAAWSALRQPWARFQGWWHAAAETPAAPPDAAQDSVAAYRLLICWIVVYLLLFSIAATKLPNYVLPAVAPCAILMARLLHRWISGALTPPHWLTATGIAGLAVTGVVIAVALPIVAGVGELWFLRGRYFDGLQYWAPLGLVPVASALIGWRFVRKQQRGRFVVALSATAVLLLVPFAAFGSVLFERFKAPRSLVEQLTMLSREDDLRIGCLDMRHLPSLNFYVQRNIEHLDGDNDVPRFLAYRLPVYLFLPARDWQRIEPQLQGKGRVLARHYDMYHHVEIVVVTNR